MMQKSLERSGAEEQKFAYNQGQGSWDEMSKKANFTIITNTLWELELAGWLALA